MKLKLFTIFLITLIVSSCGINDLEDRVGKIENALGTNEPFTVKFSTTDNNNVAIVSNAKYLFKPGGDNEYMGKYTDGDSYVDVYIERFSDVDWSDGAYIEFTYNLTTKEITNQYVGTYFYNQFGDRVNAGFRYWATGNTITISVKSINVETGAIDVVAEASSTDAYEYNEYTGKTMTGTFNFKGKLPVFDWN